MMKLYYKVVVCSEISPNMPNNNQPMLHSKQNPYYKSTIISSNKVNPAFVDILYTFSIIYCRYNV